MALRRAALMSVAVAGVLTVAGTTSASAAYTTVPTTTWSPTKGSVFAIATTADRVYVGGSFTRLRDPATGRMATRQRIFAFDRATGALIQSFDPAVNGIVRAIAVSPDGTRVYIGGQFTSVDGVSRTRLAALTASGTVVPGWDPSASRTVFDIVEHDGYLYLAGTFARIDGVNRGGMARLVAATGALDRPWRAATRGGKPRTLALGNGVLYVGGSFTSIKSQPRTYLAAVSLTNGDPTAWDPQPACDGCNLFDVATSGGSVYGAAGGPGGRAVRWNSGSGRIDWAVRADGNVQAVEVADGVLYAGGHFGPRFGGTERHQLAAVNASTGSVLPWAPDLGTNDFPGVWVVHATSDDLFVGGGFRSFEGTPQRRLAELAEVP